ncbi:MAG: TRAP transporter fused permease subunit [Thermodesulfobacteriota bacterium]
MSDNTKRVSLYDVAYGVLCTIYVWILIHYSLTMWESRQRYGVLFLSLTLMIGAMIVARKKTFMGLRGNLKRLAAAVCFVLALACFVYLWIEYPSLVWERAGFINEWDMWVSIAFIYVLIQITWSTSGPIIPVVTLVFTAYALFGHWLPGGFLYHPPISLTRFTELACAEINGVFGLLNQVGATWIAIFAFFAGLVHGFGGLDYILRLTSRMVGRSKLGVPQVAVLASMAFGGMSGSAGANAIGTGAFTIPTMKRFGMPPAIAAAIESVASSGGQIMPPILGAVAFVMCDYLDMYYYEILLASLWASMTFFGSTMLGVHFLAKRYIDPKAEVSLPAEFRGEISRQYALQGLPILFSFCVLLYVFIVHQLNILAGGFWTIVSFLASRLAYEFYVAKGNPRCAWTFLKGVYRGTLAGAAMMVPIGAMLGTLGIVIRILTTTGLGEKISFFMVSASAGHLWLLLLLTMMCCIVFGMAVTTVAAYILTVTLVAPALTQMGIPPLVAHFTVFYWAMLSAITPPVASVCVITAGLAGANFLQTCWQSMKLGIPKFLLPFIFVTYPDILKFTPGGFLVFLISGVGFAALCAGLQSGWVWWQRGIMLVLGTLILVPTATWLDWALLSITVVVFPLLWRMNYRVQAA